MNEQRDSSSTETSIKSQLLWATFFPLCIFTLVSILMVTSVFRQLTLRQVNSRDQALGRSIALELGTNREILANERMISALFEPLTGQYDIHFILQDQSGRKIAESGSLHSSDADVPSLIAQMAGSNQKLVVDPQTSEEFIITAGPLPAGLGTYYLVDSFTKEMSQTRYYQVVLILLLALGAVFSLNLLSGSIGRITNPIARLVQLARAAIPGSIFKPMEEQGPIEIRQLIRAFNQMVVRLAEQQNNLRQYAHQALLSQEEERQRLSHELHDETLQDLIGLVQRVELCRTEMDTDTVSARNRLDELQVLLGATIDNVRRISNALRPSILEDLGLTAAMRALCQDTRRQMAVECVFSVTGEERRLSPDLELAVYRVAQEALSNIRRHARNVTRVTVDLDFSSKDLELAVKNDGATFAIPEIRNLVRNGHLGLAGMYERARLFHADLQLSSDQENGTLVRMRLPVDDLP